MLTNYRRKRYEPQYLNECSPKELLINDFEQAWNHYRHIEEQRSNLMNLFFTVILATAGFLLNFMKEIEYPIKISVIIGIVAILFILFVFTLSTYFSVRKSKYTLRHYENVMAIVRSVYYKDDEYLDSISIRNSSIKELNSRESKTKSLFSIQINSELILIGALIILTISNVLLFYYLLSISDWHNIWSMLTLSCITIMFLLNIYVIKLNIKKD